MHCRRSNRHTLVTHLTHARHSSSASIDAGNSVPARGTGAPTPRRRQERATGRGVPTACVGIDVGATRLHCVAVDLDLRVLDAALFAATELDAVSTWILGLSPHAAATASRARVAIDAPAQPSTAPHADDATLSPKFRTARCAEIALGREFACWVPWVTPTARAPTSSWMTTGFSVYGALRAVAIEPIEVFPHAAFRELTRPERLPNKQTVAGVRARAAALARRGIAEPHLDLWSHDALDALVAAVVARDHARRTARGATCGHDGSAIWLPAPVPG